MTRIATGRGSQKSRLVFITVIKDLYFGETKIDSDSMKLIHINSFQHQFSKLCIMKIF